MSSKGKIEDQIIDVKMPEEIRAWARSQSSFKYLLGGMQFKFDDKILNDIILLGTIEQKIEEIQIIYPTYTHIHNLLVEPFNFTYLFTSTDIKIIINIELWYKFQEINHSKMLSLSVVEFNKIIEEAEAYERIRLVNLEKATAEAEARVKAVADAREKAETERKKQMKI